MFIYHRVIHGKSSINGPFSIPGARQVGAEQLHVHLVTGDVFRDMKRGLLPAPAEPGEVPKAQLVGAADCDFLIFINGWLMVWMGLSMVISGYDYSLIIH